VAQQHDLVHKLLQPTRTRGGATSRIRRRTRTMMGRKVPVAAFAVVAGLLFTVSAGADQNKAVDPPKSKAGRDWHTVSKDIHEGKTKKLKPATKRTTGVWNGCKFVYLTTDETTYEFDDGSVATVSENPDPLPPRNCPERNPTEAEFAEMEARVAAANGPPPPGTPQLPPDRYKGGDVKTK
jgi:hypothetical protein